MGACLSAGWLVGGCVSVCVGVGARLYIGGWVGWCVCVSVGVYLGECICVCGQLYIGVWVGWCEVSVCMGVWGLYLWMGWWMAVGGCVSMGGRGLVLYDRGCMFTVQTHVEYTCIDPPPPLRTSKRGGDRNRLSRVVYNFTRAVNKLSIIEHSAVCVSSAILARLENVSPTFHACQPDEPSDLCLYSSKYWG